MAIGLDWPEDGDSAGAASIGANSALFVNLAGGCGPCEGEVGRLLNAVLARIGGSRGEVAAGTEGDARGTAGKLTAVCSFSSFGTILHHFHERHLNCDD